MKIKQIGKLFIVFFLIIFISEMTTEKGVFAETIVFVFSGKTKTINLLMQSKDIKKIGVNDQCKEVRVELEVDDKYKRKLRKISKELVGGTISIKIQKDIVFYGKLYEPLLDGKISISSNSIGHAKRIIKKMGKNPDYEIGCEANDLRAADNGKISNSEWAIKAIEAHSNKDLISTIKFAKRAIAKDPNSPINYQILSAAYYEQGKKRLALKMLMKAEELLNEKNIKKFPGIYPAVA